MEFNTFNLPSRFVMKFSDGHISANCVDPNQTSPRGAVWSGSTKSVF